ncbi:transcription factor Tfb4-domain-containing protein [Abortiporus biennis]|nr:transcription factor Tfb4-domain-containing protein [Abortiporus biennis]
MDKASHLSIILDLSPTQWHLFAQPSPTNAHPLSLSSFLSQLFAFLNAHIACKDENTLTVYGAFPGKSILLYSSVNITASSSETEAPADANTYRPFKILDSTIATSISQQLDELSEMNEEAPVSLVSALTKSLCYINRNSNSSSESLSKTKTKLEELGVEAEAMLDPRVLIISVSPDQSAAYISMMNSIFSAQKLKVTIDVCKLYGPDSVFLQQAAHLTGGSYIYLERPDALLQYLTMSFLPPPSLRTLISVPTQDKIDFRAACFCHKQIVDIGFVCSVCLSIFCKPVPVCSTCRTKFPMKTLQRLNAMKPPTLPSNNLSNTANTPSPAASPAPSHRRTPSMTGTGTAGANSLPRSSTIGRGATTGTNGSAPPRNGDGV